MNSKLPIALVVCSAFAAGILVSGYVAPPVDAQANAPSSAAEANPILVWSKIYLQDEDLPTALAKHKRRYYEALVNEGFTEKQAFELVKVQKAPFDQ